MLINQGVFDRPIYRSIFFLKVIVLFSFVIYSHFNFHTELVMGSGVKSRVRVGFGCHPLGFGSGSGVATPGPLGFRVFSGFKK